MLYPDKDRTLRTIAIQKFLTTWGYYGGAVDNWAGAETEAALNGWIQDNFLIGDNTWPFIAEIVGHDIVVRDVVCTCFGGDDDPQDSGETASGLVTKGNPTLMGASIPMDIRSLKGAGRAEHAALDGCPLPMVPWFTVIDIESGGKIHRTKIIDLGPARGATTKPSEPHGIDLTLASARVFNPKATARNFSMRCDFTIIDGAKYVG